MERFAMSQTVPIYMFDRVLRTHINIISISYEFINFQDGSTSALVPIIMKNSFWIVCLKIISKATSFVLVQKFYPLPSFKKIFDTHTKVLKTLKVYLGIVVAQRAFACSKSTIKTSEQYVKFVQS